MLNFPRWKIALTFIACAIFILLALPNILPPETRAKMPWLATEPVNLGLDLQGGSHLLLELDYKQHFVEQMAMVVDELRVRLRKENAGYTNLQSTEDAVTVTLLNDSGQLNTMLSEIDPGLKAESKGGGTFEIRYTPERIAEEKFKLVNQSLEIVDRRVNETGTREPTIQRQGNDRILVQVPGLSDPEKLKELLGRTAKMTFHMVDVNVSQAEIAAGNVPASVMILPSDEREQMQGAAPVKYAVERRVLLSGDMLEAANATYEAGSPVISFRFNTIGTRKFGEITAKNVHKPFAIVLDGKVITAPVIQSPIPGGTGIISGNFTPESANDLALLLRAGALPVPLKVVEERTVGPSLGTDSIESGKKASYLGVGLVMGFMLICYGLFGMFANLALLMNVVMIFAALSLFNATLTLPGIAGTVLTLGMAVDANVLIYERIREELRLGKSPFAAVDSGFRMAFGTIVDSHLTTLIAAALLYFYGTGPVKGFAVTLAIGIITSLFSAVTLTRLMVATWMKRVRPKSIPI